jgi:hypothetical protein
MYKVHDIKNDEKKQRLDEKLGRVNFRVKIKVIGSSEIQHVKIKSAACGSIYSLVYSARQNIAFEIINPKFSGNYSCRKNVLSFACQAIHVIHIFLLTSDSERKVIYNFFRKSPIA